MDQRKDRRHETKLYVKLSAHSVSSWGLLGDISANGLFIKSIRGYERGEVLDLSIFMPDGSVSLLKGAVRRIVDLPELHWKFGLGVELIEKDMTYGYYHKFLGKKRKESVGMSSAS